MTRQTFKLTERGQVTDRYTKAIEQLGSNTIDVIIGGSYALERIARDSPRDRPTVMEVLAAFVREHSRAPQPLNLRDALTGIDDRGIKLVIRAVRHASGQRPSQQIS